MIWIENPEVIFDIKKLKYYFPGSSLTWEEQANALVRFIIYLSLLMYIHNGNIFSLVFPPMLMMGLQYFLHKKGDLETYITNYFNPKSSITQANNLANQQINNLANQSMVEGSTLPIGTGSPATFDDSSKTTENFEQHHDNYGISFDLEHQKHIKSPLEMKKEWDLPMNPDYERSGPRPDMGNLPPEEGFVPKEIDCKSSTKDNPFGNSMPYDTIERQVNRVCPNEFTKDENFYKGLFSNTNDLFDRNNSQRQFTTNPSSTKTNDREAAMQFFFNTPYTEH